MLSHGFHNGTWRLAMLLFLSAVGPAVAMAVWVYLKDRREPEPVSFLLRCFAYGMLAVIPAGVLETVALGPAGSLARQGTDLGRAYAAFGVAGLVQEGIKFLVLLLLIYRAPSFTEPLDGVVYATFVGLGFATVENLEYVTRGGYAVAVSRAIFSVPGHGFLGVIMGYYLGLARFAAAGAGPYLWRAFAIPWLLHGTYDFFALGRFENSGLAWGFLAVVAVTWVVALARLRALVAVSRRDSGPHRG